jgi:cytochrome c-type biogenesis protein CcmF
MTFAHVGLAFWTLGVTYAGLFSVEKDVRLGPGQAAQIGAYRFLFEGTQVSTGPNYRADIGTMQVQRDGRRVATLRPEKRLYPSQNSVMTEAAVDHNPLRDLYVALGEPIGERDWALRLYYKPMMRLVWFGGLLMFIGGGLAASDRRYRLSRRATAAATANEAATA